MLNSVKIGGQKSAEPGAHAAEFLGAEEIENDFGPGVRWEFKIIGGLDDGKVVRRFTSQKFGPKSTAGALTCGMAGIPLGTVADVDLGAMVGRQFNIIVEPTQSGGVRVASVSPNSDSVPF